MSRSKLQRFDEIREFTNVFEHPEEMSGHWRERVFGGADGDIIVELGCGKSEFSLEMARRHPDKLFIAVDKKGERIWSGAKAALEEGLENLVFARFDLMKLYEYFGESEVDAFWITFPDPFPRKGNANRRPTGSRFMKWYKEMLVPGGLVHLKTDHAPLYEFTKEVLGETAGIIQEDIPDLYTLETVPSPLDILTTYEKRHLKDGRRISYLSFTP